MMLPSTAPLVEVFFLSGLSTVEISTSRGRGNGRRNTQGPVFLSSPGLAVAHSLTKHGGVRFSARAVVRKIPMHTSGPWPK